MPPNSPVGHATVKNGAFTTAAGHRLRAESVGLAQHDREQRHGQVRAGDEQAAAVAHQPGLLDLGADHDAGRVAQNEERDVEGVAQLHEARGLVGAVAVDGAGEVGRVVGDTPIGRPSMRMNAVTMPRPKRGRSSSTEPASASRSMTVRMS